MILGELIKALESADPTHVSRIGLVQPHSYRGYYDQLAFAPARDVSVADMLRSARSAVGKTFCGYKGGEFRMDLDAECYVATHGQCGEEIGPVLVALMTGGEIEL